MTYKYYTAATLSRSQKVNMNALIFNGAAKPEAQPQAREYFDKSRGRKQSRLCITRLFLSNLLGPVLNALGVYRGLLLISIHAIHAINMENHDSIFMFGFTCSFLVKHGRPKARHYSCLFFLFFHHSWVSGSLSYVPIISYSINLKSKLFWVTNSE